MPKFEVIDHTADIGIIAYGGDLEEAFANLAYGMFSLIAELDGVGEGVCRQIEVKAVRKLQHPVRSSPLASFLDGLPETAAARTQDRTPADPSHDEDVAATETLGHALADR